MYQISLGKKSQFPPLQNGDLKAILFFISLVGRLSELVPGKLVILGQVIGKSLVSTSSITVVVALRICGRSSHTHNLSPQHVEGPEPKCATCTFSWILPQHHEVVSEKAE